MTLNKHFGVTNDWIEPKSCLTPLISSGVGPIEHKSYVTLYLISVLSLEYSWGLSKVWMELKSKLTLIIDHVICYQGYEKNKWSLSIILLFIWHPIILCSNVNQDYVKVKPWFIWVINLIGCIYELQESE